MDSNLSSQVKSLLDSSSDILILLKKDPTIDDVAAGLALYSSLLQTGKIVSLACPTPLTVEFSNLFSVDKVNTKIGNKNLVISLDYTEGSIEKVSYNVEGNKFNLIIQPKAGFPLFSPEKVNYSYSGVGANLVFVIGAGTLSDLDNFYTENQKFFDSLPLININRNDNATNFGKVDILNKSASSNSELVFDLIKTLDYKIDPDALSNIITGIDHATNNLTINSTADTFEAVALCLRMGGKRYLTPKQIEEIQSVVTQPQVIPSPVISVPSQPPVSPLQPSTQPLKEQITVSSDKPEVKKEETKPKTPPDWLQPKIYRGGQLL